MEAPLPGRTPELAAPTTVGVGVLVVGEGGGLEEDLKKWVGTRGNPGERDTLTRNDQGYSSRTCLYST